MNEDKTHLDWLRDRLGDFESKLADAERTVARLKPAVVNLRGTIDALNAAEQGPRPSEPLFLTLPTSPNGEGTQNLGAPFTAGNKNPNMPERRLVFANGTLLEAAGQLVDASAEPLHADVVTNAIFVIRDKKEFALAKHSVASELYRGAKKGLWAKAGPNLYRRP